MKNITAKHIALSIAAINAALLIIIFGFFYYFKDVNYVIFSLFGVLFTFVFTYIPVLFILQYFILNRIDPIYKTIKSITIPHNKLVEKIEEKDIIQELNTEVMSWANEKAKEIEQLKFNETLRKEFIGNIAHELKTPVFNIQGYTLTLLDGAMDDKDITKKYLKRSAKNISRMITIIRDIDTITRLESGIQKLNIQKFNLSKLITEVIDLSDIKKEKYHIEIDYDEQKYKDIFVLADREKLFELFNNLLVNSLKYGTENGNTQIYMRQELRKVFVSIEDNGIGIAQEDLPRIFERFYRVDKSRSRERGGSGLGLSIVKHIIEAHHEQMEVESKPGRGTKFTFSLQLAHN